MGFHKKSYRMELWTKRLMENYFFTKSGECTGEELYEPVSVEDVHEIREVLLEIMNSVRSRSHTQMEEKRGRRFRFRPKTLLKLPLAALHLRLTFRQTFLDWWKSLFERKHSMNNDIHYFSNSWSTRTVLLCT